MRLCLIRVELSEAAQQRWLLIVFVDQHLLVVEVHSVIWALRY